VLFRGRGAGLDGVPEAASWPCLAFTPGSEPLRELAVRMAPVAGADAAAILPGLATDPEGFALTARQAAVARPPGAPEGAGQQRVLLVVDQFEQLFTAAGPRQCRGVTCRPRSAQRRLNHASNRLLLAIGDDSPFFLMCADEMIGALLRTTATTSAKPDGSHRPLPRGRPHEGLSRRESPPQVRVPVRCDAFDEVSSPFGRSIGACLPPARGVRAGDGLRAQPREDRLDVMNVAYGAPVNQARAEREPGVSLLTRWREGTPETAAVHQVTA